MISSVVRRPIVKYVTTPNISEFWPLPDHQGVTAQVVIAGRNMTSLMSVWEPHSESPIHSHPHEQIGVSLQGEAVFIIDGTEYLVKKGDVYYVPPNVPHGQRNDGDEPVIFMECFSPVRDDLLQRRFEQKIHD